MKLLELNHVEKSFGDLKVLKDISMSVEDGEIVSIIGPSGSGKSTLLRCATMLETMDRGEVVYLGKKAVWGNDSGSIQYASPAELKEIRSQYGLVFQNFNLFPHFSVMKNITDAPIHVQKRNKEEVYSEARELLKKMGLEDKEDAYRLLDKFNQAQEAMSQQHSSLYADAKFLNTNETQLKDTFDSLNVERGALEDIDTVDVIMELSWAQMCYNAALQVGTNVIPQSLMDYMK